MRRFLVLLVLLGAGPVGLGAGSIGLAACDAGGAAGPSLPDSLMVEALVEVHLADARAARTDEPADSLRAAALARHGLDTTTFHRALDYYARHPDALRPLYDRALDRLLAEQQRLD